MVRRVPKADPGCVYDSGRRRLSIGLGDGDSKAWFVCWDEGLPWSWTPELRISSELIPFRASEFRAYKVQCKQTSQAESIFGPGRFLYTNPRPRWALYSVTSLAERSKLQIICRLERLGIRIENNLRVRDQGCCQVLKSFCTKGLRDVLFDVDLTVPRNWAWRG